MKVENYDFKNLKIDINKKIGTADTSSLTSVSRSSSSLTMSLTPVDFEKIIENKSKLAIKFIPLEAVEHTIDIIERSKSLKGEHFAFDS